MSKFILSICLLFILVIPFNSCSTFVSLSRYPFPRELKDKIFEEALHYQNCSYAWGGQSYYYKVPCNVDCSGFVINVYKRVLSSTPFKLPFEDTDVIHLLKYYTIPTDTPEKGDLVFMGEEGISHIAIFQKIEDGNIYFIDAFSTTGKVSVRVYRLGNYKIKSFGIMEVIKR